MADKLTSTDYAALIVLRRVGREITNNELAERYDIRLVGDQLKRLRKEHVATEKIGSQYQHALTPAGEAAADRELSIEDGQEKRTTREKFLWAALVVRRETAEPVPPVAANGAGLDDRIRAAYARLATAPGAWVSLTDLRPLLSGSSRTDVDRALTRLLGAPDVRLEPEPFRHRIADADRAAALHVGGEDRHKLAIGLR